MLEHPGRTKWLHAAYALFFCWNWSCHCHCHGVKVVTPLLLLQWKAGADTALKGTPSWLCISSQAQCFGNFSLKEKMRRIHISWLSLDKKQATSAASNPVALATRETSPLLQGDPDNFSLYQIWKMSNSTLQFRIWTENPFLDFSSESEVKLFLFGFQFRIWTETQVFSSDSELKLKKCGFQFRFWTEIQKRVFSSDSELKSLY